MVVSVALDTNALRNGPACVVSAGPCSVRGTGAVTDFALHIDEGPGRITQSVSVLCSVSDDMADHTAGLVVPVPVKQCLKGASVRCTQPLPMFRGMTRRTHCDSDITSALALV